MERACYGFKGSDWGPKGFYFHVVVDLYSRFPEVAMVENTSFESLKPKLDEVFSRFGIPEKVTHDGGPPYNSFEWRKYAKQKGFELDVCTPEHPQSNRVAEKMMKSIIKVVHAAFATKTYPVEAVQTFLLEYWSTPHPSTGKTPSQLLMNSNLKL